MANNYLEFSETLGRLTPDEEAWLRQQLEIIHVYGDREYKEEDVPADVDRAEGWYGCRAWRDLPDYDSEDGTLVGFEYDFLSDDDPDGEGRYLWVHTEEWGYPERVAHLVQKFLSKFRPNDHWSLSYATTCSKPRAGEFGGGCAFVTAAQIEWCSTWEFIEERTTAFKKADSQGREDQPETSAANNNRLRAYNLAIDGPALRGQRQWLLDVADSIHQGRQPLLSRVDAELLEGLINLTDSIADQAADRYGIDCLLPVSQEAEVGDADNEPEPEDRLTELVEDLGLTDEDLDGIVHDVVSEIASDVNNGGVSSQIEYLLAQLGEESTDKNLRQLAEEKGGTS